MKKIMLLLLGITSCSFVRAEEPTTLGVENVCSPCQETKEFHQIFAGPDIFYFRIRGHHWPWTIKGDGMCYGLRAGYDYMKPDHIYYGAEGVYALGHDALSARSDSPAPFWPSRTSYKRKMDFGNLEGRFGYNFQTAKALMMTPFFGVGYYHIQKTHGLAQNWAYAALGLRSTYTFTKAFNLGVNLKCMEAFYGAEGCGIYRSNGNSGCFGYEIALPATWSLVKKNERWGIQLQPYYTKFNAHAKDENLFGSRLLVSYDF